MVFLWFSTKTSNQVTVSCLDAALVVAGRTDESGDVGLGLGMDQQLFNQWDFQDPKLEVPTIYKAYFILLYRYIIYIYIEPFI